MISIRKWTNIMPINRYPIGKCQGLPCNNNPEEVPLIGYCYVNMRVDAVNPKPSVDKLNYCIACYNYFKIAMDKKMEEERKQGLNPQPWFYFYIPSDREKYDRR